MRKQGFTPLETIKRQEKKTMSLTGFTPLETIKRQEKKTMSLTGFTPLETIKRQEKKTMSLTGFTLIELMVVVGIVSLVTGAMLAFLITSRNSAQVSEARLQATEYAQRAMDRITKELRLSNPFNVRITNAMGWIPEVRPGSVINFQIPVGIYGTLDLDDGWLKWGSEDTEGLYIAYSLNQNSQLLRSTYAAADASDAVSRVIAPHITAFTFNRTDSSSELIHIIITAQIQTPRPISHTLESDVKLRN